MTIALILLVLVGFPAMLFLLARHNEAINRIFNRCDDWFAGLSPRGWLIYRAISVVGGLIVAGLFFALWWGQQ